MSTIVEFFISTQIIARIILLFLMAFSITYTTLASHIDNSSKGDVYKGWIVISLLLLWGGFFR